MEQLTVGDRLTSATATPALAILPSPTLVRNVYLWVALFVTLLLGALAYWYWANGQAAHIDRVSNEFHFQSIFLLTQVEHEVHKALTHTKSDSPHHHRSDQAVSDPVGMEDHYRIMEQQLDQLTRLSKDFETTVPSTPMYSAFLRSAHAQLITFSEAIFVAPGQRSSPAITDSLDDLERTIVRLKDLHLDARESGIRESGAIQARSTRALGWIMVLSLILGAVIARRSIIRLNRILTEQSRVEINLREEITRRSRAETDLLARLRLEQLIATISTQLTDHTGENPSDQSIQECLASMGTYSAADRVCLYQFCRIRPASDQTHLWRAGERKKETRAVRFRREDLEWLIVRMGEEQTVQINIPDDLPPEADIVKNQLAEEACQSLLCAPLWWNGTVQGLIWWETRTPSRAWQASDTLALTECAFALSHALARRQTEQELRESRRRLEEAQRVGNIGTWELDLETDVLNLSSECYRIFEVDSSEIEHTKKGFLNTLYPSDRKRVAHALSRAIRLGEAVDLTLRILMPDERTKHIRLRFEAHRLDGERRPCLIGTMVDMTEQQRAKLALKESEARYRAIFSSAAEGICLFDGQGTIREVNPAYQQMMGYTRDELIGTNLSRLIHPDHRHQLPDFFVKAGSNSVATTEGMNVTKDGRFIHVEVRGSRCIYQGKEAVVAVIRDVTEQAKAESALRSSEEKYRQLVELAQEGIWRIDADGSTLYANPAIARMLGCTPDEMIGQPVYAFMDPKTAEDTRHLLDRRRRGITEQHETELIRKDGKRVYATVGATPVFDSSGKYTGALAGLMDITERRRAEDELRRSAIVFENTRDGIIVTDAESRIVATNKAFTDITGFEQREALGKNPSILQSGRHNADFYAALWQHLKETGSWQGELWDQRKNGEFYPSWTSISVVTDEADQVCNYIAVFSDISRIKQSEAQLEHLAHYDPLTELPNRLLLQSRLAHALERAARHGHRAGLLFLDLDRFKNVNDSLGHPTGDQLLQAIARRLSCRIRKEDTLARWGGDEFVVLLESVQNARDAASLAEELIGQMKVPFELHEGNDIYIGLSVGISLYPENGSDGVQLIQNADAAMYKAKEQGRNTYRFYTEELTVEANNRLVMENRLRKAVERGEFTLYYQPQLNVQTGKIIGAEALIRWQHPEQGLIPPDVFIPVAEETGLINGLGDWVIRTVCAQIRQWERAGLDPAFSVSVNLSTRQFAQPSLARKIRDILRETGIKPERLHLEITESAIMTHGQSADDSLHTLKDLGVSIAIDDFGTGYSSLAYLKRFAIDTLKIDQSFVRDIPHDSSDVEIAATIIAMARNLGLNVIAEGVETTAQLEFLRIRGCDAYQGYLDSPPLPVKQFTDSWLYWKTATPHLH
ncbi:MAG: EAL domain-containing protein [Pseudomonadota bacterium]|nr:EAL domain-containing protein [Pseudomonadota bacterium]